MKASTMQSNHVKSVGKALKILLPVGFWLAVWELISIIVGNSFLFPSIGQTATALVGLVSDPDFYLVILFSCTRVLLGLVLGIMCGIAVAFLCNYFRISRALLFPAITVIKSTPVASFIVVLWVSLSGDTLSVFIGFLMVMPIIAQNLVDGFGAIDKGLTEVADVFNFSFKRRLKFLIIPTLRSYLTPAIITSVGLAWKAEIAAEIIAYTKMSIGQGINDAKFDMDTARVFAWTVIIIIFSIMLEKTTKVLLGRIKK